MAEAIFAKYVADGGGQGSLDEMTHGTQEMYRGYARAAIEAMREPTEAMCMVPMVLALAGRLTSESITDETCADVWVLMIDAALA